MFNIMTHRTLAWIPLAITTAINLPTPGLGADSFMGLYEGTYRHDRTQTTKATAKVIAEGPSYYRVLIQAEPLVAGDPTHQFEIYGTLQGRGVNLFGRANALRWNGSIEENKLAASPGYYGQGLELQKVSPKSPTEGAQPPADAVVLLPFKPGTPPDTSAWNSNWEALDDGSLRCRPGKGSITTKKHFGDIRLHLEFWLPLMADTFGQNRANSGVIINNIYEVQVLDSFGLVPSMGDCGAIYDSTRPKLNACFPPEQWQTYDIVFRAPRIDPDGTLREPARVTVDLNGIRVQDNVAIAGATAGSPRGRPPINAATGPLHLQDHGNQVRYRNVWLQELSDAKP